MEKEKVIELSNEVANVLIALFLKNKKKNTEEDALLCLMAGFLFVFCKWAKIHNKDEGDVLDLVCSELEHLKEQIKGNKEF